MLSVARGLAAQNRFTPGSISSSLSQAPEFQKKQVSALNLGTRPIVGEVIGAEAGS